MTDSRGGGTALALRAIGRTDILKDMPSVQWRDNVAALLEEVAKALVVHQDRRAVVAIGTALAYLERARARGERDADHLLSQLRAAVEGDRTERFQFAPGELEAIKSNVRK